MPRLRHCVAAIAVHLVAAASHARAQQPSPSATLAWPGVFPSPASATSGPFKQARARAGGIEIEVAYVPDWDLYRNPAPELLVAHTQDWSRAIAVTPPMPAAFTISRPLTPEALTQLLPTVMRTRAANQFKPLAVGQVRTADGTLWVWFEFDVSPMKVPTDLTPLERMNFEQGRVWTFATTSSGYFFTVNCHVLTPRESSDAANRDRVQRAAADCAWMITQVRTTRLPQ